MIETSRFPTLLAALVLCALAMLAGAGAAAALPRAKVMVATEVIRLGDLFPETGDKAGVVVGMAPRPGGRAIFDADRLFTIARTHQVAWRPTDRSDYLVVERAGRSIERREVEDTLHRAISAQGIAEGVRIELANTRIALYAPAESTTPLTVEELDIDRSRMQFSARLAIAGDGASPPTVVRGRLIKMVDLPTPARALRKGDVIAATDLEPVSAPADSLAADVVRDAGQLIGKTPSQSLRAGEPVRLSQVQVPVIIAKGAQVTMTLRTPQMILTATGHALQDGAEGATIKVTNARTNGTVVGVVSGPGQVVVAHPTAPAP